MVLEGGAENFKALAGLAPGGASVVSLFVYPDRGGSILEFVFRLSPSGRVIAARATVSGNTYTGIDAVKVFYSTRGIGVAYVYTA